MWEQDNGQNEEGMRSKLCQSPGGAEGNVEGVEWRAQSVVDELQKTAAEG